MINDQLIRRLEKLAVKWDQASNQLTVDDAVGIVEDDTMSAIYDETATELRNIIRNTRVGATGTEPRWEPVPAEKTVTLLLVPGEEYGTTRVPDDNRTWGMVLGDPDKVALVILGTREEVVKKLDDAAREIEHSYGAEHENALHTEYEGRCPECRKHGPTTRVGENWESDDEPLSGHHNAVQIDEPAGSRP